MQYIRTIRCFISAFVLSETVPEELYNRIKAHLEREKKRTGKRLSQKDFVIGLIERELDEAERREEEESHADVE